MQEFNIRPIEAALNPPMLEPRALREPEAAAYIGVKRAKFRSLEAEGEIPKALKIGRASVWLKEDLDAYLDRLVREQRTGTDG